MGLIRRETFVCLDCETTGLEPAQDRIIEVAAAKFMLEGAEVKILDQFETLVDPECLISPESMAIHHITDEMVQGKPKIQEILPKVLEFAGEHILIGHRIEFDIQFLKHSADRHNIPCTLDKNRQADTLRLGRHYGGAPANSLEVLRKHFNIPAEGAHRAMNDVLVNIQVFKRLATHYITTEKLFEILQKAIRIRLMPLGKHKGRPFSEVPLDYLIWASKKEFDLDLSFSIREEINLRKKGGAFRQASNPFQGL